jgi:NADH-quinone oxidoreductase subunit N
MYLTKTHTRLTNLKVLSVNHPVLALILSLTMFSLSGIPPLAGFFVKFEIFNSILNSGQYFILLVVFILTVFSFFYYLRIIKIIYFENTTIIKKNKFNNLLKLRLISILIGVLVFFVFLVKEPLLIILENSIISLFYLK